MPTTPKYGWPYQHPLDQPHGPNLGEKLALAVETTVSGIDTGTDARLDVLEAQLPYRARQILSAPALGVFFTGIPSTLRSLTAVWTARADNAVDVQFMQVRINNVGTASYSYEYGQANNATAAAAAAASVTSGVAGFLTGANAAAGVFGSGVLSISGWDSPHSGNLGWQFTSQALGTGLANFFASFGGGVFGPAGPYNQVVFFPQAGNFVAGSDFQIYGERA